MLELDHLLWEELRLDEGERRFAERTGVIPAFGGDHPDTGTHNSLLSLGGGRYLEIISLDPAHLRAASLPEQAVLAFKPKLYTFGVRTHDLALVERLAGAGGLTVSRPHNVSRRVPDGTILKWQTIVLEKHEFGDFMPFFTRFDGMLHPSETAPQGCNLLEFSVGHPQYQELSRLYTALKLNVPVFESEYPLLLAVVATPKGIITLDSSEGFRV